MNLNLPFNWFDVVLLLMAIIGIRQGRKHGLSVELLSMLKWVTIALGCAFLYQPIGSLISQNSVFSRLSGYLLAYIGLALLITIGFVYLKSALGGKLLGSDTFGSSEFYLGMVAGLVRFCCILLAVVAVLNARYYNPAEKTAALKYQNEVYGSSFFPSLFEIQEQVFEHSLTGPLIKGHLGFLLIDSTAPEQRSLRRREFATP